MRYRMAILLVTLGWLLWSTAPAGAHGGEEHGDSSSTPQTILPSGLGNFGTGDHFEVVITPAGDGSSWLYLTDAASNAPATNATIAVDAQGSPPWTGETQAGPMAGVYRLAWTPPQGQAFDLTLTVASAGRTDLILIQIPATADPVATPSGTPLQRHGPIGAAFAVGTLAGWLLAGKRGKAIVATALFLLTATLTASLAHANGNDNHGAPPPQAAVTSTASGRQVSLPKASQRLIDLRTTPAVPREVAETLRLVGRVIPNPAAHARIHPQVPSRIIHDADFPPPRSGQWVKRGETLAVLDPILSVVEKGGQRLMLSRGERTETTMGREMVLAPISGQLTDVHIIPGEVVTEGVTLAEIIDPARLWVEAILHDLPLAEGITEATASTRQIPNRKFPLHRVGISPKINPEDQGLHLQFAVAESFGLLKTGMPVDVYAATGTISFPVAIPREAVLDLSGLPLVWIKIAPERFEGRPIRLGRRTAEWVEVLEGLHPGERVVVQGHNQLNAIR